MRAFLSYQTTDKKTAADVGKLLETLGIKPFMAHEHIEVSNDWRLEILKQIKAAHLFVPILSANYYSSVWCVQESGIASFRKMTIIPLSIDSRIPEGFLNRYQSTKIDPNSVQLSDLLPGLVSHDPKFFVEGLITRTGNSRGYRGAEHNFWLLRPFLDRASKEQIVRLLTLSAHNSQIYDAGECHSVYLPPLIKTHGRYMKRADLKKLKTELKKYNAPV